MALERCTPAVSPGSPGHLALQGIRTPLNVSAWREALRGHYDQTLAHYIVRGLNEGFRIGFDRSHSLVSTKRNLPSATEQEEVFAKYLEKEVTLGRIIGPFQPSSEWHINRVGVIPKGHTPGKWRMITDLSHPPAASVNDGIDRELCTLSYVTVEQVARKVSRLGKGALLAKVDIESAYRLVPIHPDDRPLLSIQWKKDVYVDAMLPFGLRSAPKIFTAIADALEWIVRQRGVELVEHYLDDYILMGGPHDRSCQHGLDVFVSTCAELGVPLAEHKQEGPCTRLTFLGIEIDTILGILCLPTEKLNRLKEMLREWSDRKVCTRRELESLVGSLNHACKVVKPGRSFLRRILDLLRWSGASAAPQPHHHIRLNREFRSDLQWWRSFIVGWNGVSVWKEQEQPTIKVTSDASGSWGCGAWCKRLWFNLQWPEVARDLSITVKELLPILIASALWGHQWARHKVQCQCDNEAVVAVLASRTSKQPHLMHLLRCLFFIEACYDLEVTCVHIPGVDNDLADDLSRNRVSAFLSKVPEASQQPTYIPKPLLNLLLDPQLDWLSPHWTNRFNSFVGRA